MPESLKPLTDGINALTAYANTVTGESDTTLSDAVASLADGYGQGSGSDYEGLEVQYNSNKETTGYVWHGRTVPNYALTRLQYSSSSILPISFPDLPTYFGSNALMFARIKVSWADLREVEVLGSSSMRQDWNTAQGYASDVVNMPKLTGIGSVNNPFGYTGESAPGEYHFDGMTNIIREMFTNISHPNFTVSFGSVGTAVQTCGKYPFRNSTAAASGTVTTYTTGAYLDTVRASLENAIGNGNITFVYKASEATTYNGTSYAAGDTILTSTP